MGSHPTASTDPGWGYLPGASRREAGASRWADEVPVWDAKSSLGRFAHPGSQSEKWRWLPARPAGT